MTAERSRQLGVLVMVASGLQLLLFLLGAARRSYTAVAIPVFAGLAVVSGLGFWIGYTMATAQWDDYEDEELPAQSDAGDVVAP